MNAFRTDMLCFCLREGIAPEELAEATSNWSDVGIPTGQTLSEAVAGDWPLRLVCLAHRLFWN